MSTNDLSVKKAIVIGLIVVNGPVFALLAAGAILGVTAGGGVVTTASIAAFVAGLGLAWLWWSLAVPRWRAWAQRRGADPAGLQKWGEIVGLVWPKGWIFERTELPPRRPTKGGGAS